MTVCIEILAEQAIVHKWSSAVHFVSEDEVIEQNVGGGEKVPGQRLWDPRKKMKREEEHLLKNMLKGD